MGPVRLGNVIPTRNFCSPPGLGQFVVYERSFTRYAIVLPFTTTKIQVCYPYCCYPGKTIVISSLSNPSFDCCRAPVSATGAVRQGSSADRCTVVRNERPRLVGMG